MKNSVLDRELPVPQAVVFDLGKVLLDFDYSRAARALASGSDRTVAEIQEVLDHSPLLFRFETGQINAREMFREVVRESGFRGTFAEFSMAFADIFTEMPAVIALHAELRDRGVPTYIFSNTNELAVEHIRREHAFFSTFHGYVLSYEAGCMKPKPAIYDAVERLTQRRGSDLLYIDDRAENIATAVGRNWQVVHQVSVPATITHVRQRLGWEVADR